MNCPECGDTLKAGAYRCRCGWSAKPEKAAAFSIERDTRCTYTAKGERCCYPVGFYDVGARDGWCFFHRNIDARTEQAKGADIVRQSIGVTPSRYLQEVFAAAYPEECPPQFQELRNRAERVQDEKRLFRESGKADQFGRIKEMSDG